jgi:hypothetical protein
MIFVAAMLLASVSPKGWAGQIRERSAREDRCAQTIGREFWTIRQTRKVSNRTFDHTKAETCTGNGFCAKNTCVQTLDNKASILFRTPTNELADSYDLAGSSIDNWNHFPASQASAAAHESAFVLQLKSQVEIPEFWKLVQTCSQVAPFAVGFADEHLSWTMFAQTVAHVAVPGAGVVVGQPMKAKTNKNGMTSAFTPNNIRLFMWMSPRNSVRFQ